MKPLLPSPGLSSHLVRELRSDHAGETGAVCIYKGIRAVAQWRGDLELLAFAQAHGATEAEHLAARLASGAPVALANLKRLVRDAADNDLHTHLDLESRLFQQCAATSDFTEGVTAFLGKREAKFTGR